MISLYRSYYPNEYIGSKTYYLQFIIVTYVFKLKKLCTSSNNNYI